MKICFSPPKLSIKVTQFITLPQLKYITATLTPCPRHSDATLTSEDSLPTKWLLKQTGLRRYGGGMMKSGIKTFWKRRMSHYIVALLIEFAVKALAYKFGWYYQLLFHEKHNQTD